MLQCAYIVSNQIKAKYQIVSAKAVVHVDFPAYALSTGMHKQIALRIAKGNNSNRTGP